MTFADLCFLHNENRRKEDHILTLPCFSLQESLGYRISTRSTHSVPDYESNEVQSRNNEQIEQEVQYNIKQVEAPFFSPSNHFLFSAN